MSVRMVSGAEALRFLERPPGSEMKVALLTADEVSTALVGRTSEAWNCDQEALDGVIDSISSQMEEMRSKMGAFKALQSQEYALFTQIQHLESERQKALEPRPNSLTPVIEEAQTKLDRLTLRCQQLDEAVTAAETAKEKADEAFYAEVAVRKDSTTSRRRRTISNATFLKIQQARPLAEKALQRARDDFAACNQEKSAQQSRLHSLKLQQERMERPNVADIETRMEDVRRRLVANAVKLNQLDQQIRSIDPEMVREINSFIAEHIDPSLQEKARSSLFALKNCVQTNIAV